MKECLVTKHSGSVSDSNLLRFGEFRIGVTKVSSPTQWTQGFGFKFQKEAKLEIIGNGYFTDKTLVSNNGKSLTIPANTSTNVFVSNGDFEIAVLDKYSLSMLQDYGEYSAGHTVTGVYNKKISNIEVFKYCVNIVSIVLCNTQVSGDIGKLSTLTSLTSLSLSNTQVSGDVGKLSTLTSLTSLGLGDNQVSGDVGKLSTLTSLTYLYLSNTQVSGDVGKLSTLTSLTSLSLGNTQVSGDVGKLSTLTSLTSLGLSNTQVSGDVGKLSTLTSLTSLGLSNFTTPLKADVSFIQNMNNLAQFQFKYSQLTGDLAKAPSSLKFISLQNDAGSVLSWSSRLTSANIIAIEGNGTCNDIDAMLINQAQCKVGFSPSNTYNFKIISLSGNRTSASDSAVQTLQQKGYTINIAKA